MNDLLERFVALLREGTLPVMLPLIFVCLMIFVISVERGLYLYGGISFLLFWWPPARKKAAKMKRSLSDAFEQYEMAPSRTARHKILRAASSMLTPYTSYLTRVLSGGDPSRSELRDLKLSEAAVREEIGIERGLRMLSTFAKAAPLLGLLGTVTGMIQTFRVMMLSSTSDPRALSSGISIALIATEVGLIVSLPGVITSSWLHRRAKTLIEEIHIASMRLRQVAPEARPQGGSNLEEEAYA